MARSLILANTRGLARLLTKESVARGVPATLVGRWAGDAAKDPALAGALFRAADLADPYALPQALCHHCVEGTTHVVWTASAFLPAALTDLRVEDVRYMSEASLVGMAAALATVHRLKKLAKPLADAPGAPYHLMVIVSSAAWKAKAGMTAQGALQAAAAHFARSFAAELAADLPGSKATIYGVPDLGDEADQAAVASRIWENALTQDKPLREVRIKRNHDLTPRLDFEAISPDQDD